jgi:hypothetical protein
MKEIWKPVMGHEGLYEVSSLGRVKSLFYKKTQNDGIMRLCLDKYGYLYVQLRKRKYKVHRLVAEAFLGGIPLDTVHHINGIKDDNRVKNLEWATWKQQNQVHKGISLIVNNKKYNSIREASDLLQIDRKKLSRMVCENRSITI